MSQFDDDFERRFPRGLGEPIVRRKSKFTNGEAFVVHEGGPVDLEDPDIIAAEVANRLRIYPYAPATPEVYNRAMNNVRGIIYDGDKTYRYFIWLTVSRTYQHQPVKKRFCGDGTGKAKFIDEIGGAISGPSGPGGSKGGDKGDKKGKGKGKMSEEEEGGEMWTKTVKVPFLVWMGSPRSFLSFDTVDVFFSGPEFEYSRYQLTVDGTLFLFRGPDGNSNFNHYNILGKDFMESRRVEDGVKASIDLRLLGWDSEQGKAWEQMEREYETIDQQSMETRQAVQAFERELGLDVREAGGIEVGEEGKKEDETGGVLATEPTRENAASAQPNRLTNGEGQNEKDLEGKAEMKECEGGRAEPQIGLRERRIVDLEGLAASPSSSPISRKKGKMSGLVSKEDTRVSGGRTGSGMRRRTTGFAYDVTPCLLRR
ncbi:uncharacterized protein DFL_001118 [Arthrobotrys flagrans]|uniref:Uncharacterized protein n=1 Tax=Arthrobotrys flagrans TaxID=97331 RepID=A0A437AG82_ARTFL|nr:hypothetical protein DFL_001118 [Arthrobotrys flagrans]